MTVRLEVLGLAAGYEGRAVVEGIDLRVDDAEVVCLLGPNGAGKTSTLLAIAGVIRRLEGSVLLDGVAMAASTPHRVARAGLALVPEDRSLFPSLTVAEHLRLGRSAGGPTDRDVFGWFPALARLHSRRVGLLSGGEQQMVAVARALMGRPKVVMIDELSLGLAPLVVRSLLDTIRVIATETGCGVLLVEQHVQLALAVADRAYVLSRGRIVTSGTASELEAEPELLRASYLGSATDAANQGT